MKTLAALAIVLFLPIAASAHHTVANTVDITKAVVLTGDITNVEWKYPHVIYHLAVRGADATVIWDIESRHPQGMRQDRVDMDTINVGDHVTMNVMLAKDGTHHAATISVVLADGRRFSLCTVTNNACPPSPASDVRVDR